MKNPKDEAQIADLKARIAALDSKIHWWMISDKDSDTEDHIQLIELSEIRKARYEEILRNLEEGRPQTHCETCAHYCEKGLDGGNNCSVLPLCWFDTWEYIFCTRYEEGRQ